jgi:hypothetical protein
MFLAISFNSQFLVFSEFKHMDQGLVSVQNGSVSNKSKAFRERFENLKPSEKGSIRILLTNESLLI